MSKTVTIGKSKKRHLRVGDKLNSPLCGATHPVSDPTIGEERTRGEGTVTCGRCKNVLERAVKNLLA